MVVRTAIFLQQWGIIILYSQNMFVYSLNDPINFTDIFGTSPEGWAYSVGGLIVSGVGQLAKSGTLGAVGLVFTAFSLLLDHKENTSKLTDYLVAKDPLCLSVQCRRKQREEWEREKQQLREIWKDICREVRQ